MKSVENTIARAARRDLIDRALHRSGWGLAAAALLGVITLAVDRLAGLDLSYTVYLILAGTGLAAGVLLAFLSRQDRLAVAVRLDRRLRLKDRLGTAAVIAADSRDTASVHDPQFAELVQAHAHRLAESLDVRPAVPIRITRIWLATLSLTVALWMGVAYLPMAPDKDSSSNQTPGQQLQVQNQASEISQSIQQAVADLPQDQSLDPQSHEELEALDRLARQLASQPASEQQVQSAREESAAHLTELSDRLAERSQREMAAAQELARRFAGLEAPGGPTPPMSAQEFTEAIQRGDFGEAAQQLDELLQNEDGLSPEDHRAAAEHLQRLADQLQQADSMPPTGENERREQLMQALRDQGLDEQAIDDILEHSPASREELEGLLRQHNLDEQIAHDMARDLHEQSEREQLDEQADRESRQISEALDQAAEQMEGPSPEQSPPSPPPPSTSQPQPSEHVPADAPPSEPSSPEDQKSSGSPTEMESQNRPQPGTTQPDQRPAERQSATQPQVPKQGKPSTSRPSETSDSPSRSSPTTAPQAGEQSPAAERQPASSATQPSPSGGAQPDRGVAEPQQSDQATQPHSAEDLPAGAQPQPQSQPDMGNPQSQEQPSTGDTQPKPSPSETLRRLAERYSSARDQRQASERLRQAARELAQNMSPEERQRWAQQWQRQAGDQTQESQPQPSAGSTGRDEAQSPGGTEAGDQPSLASTASNDPLQPLESQEIDLRGDEPADQLITQWLSDDSQAEPGRTDQGAGQEQIRRAQNIAERAVNDSAVQKRYHKAIKRYFGRLNETIKKAAGDSPTPGQQPATRASS